MKIGVTGANGFVGGYVLPALAGAGHSVRALVRSPQNVTPEAAAEIAAIPTIDGAADPAALQTAMAGLDCVVHLAAHVHVMRAAPDDAAFNDVNVEGSARLFEAAAAAGVKRVVFMSSVKAAGERSGANPVSARDTPAPEDAYGRSKLAAETRLRALAAGSACELVILRPAFVYGWPPAGNFKSVISAVLRGVPLPLSGIANARDMTYAGNLADAVLQACTVPGLSDTPYFISDGTPVSTPDLFLGVAAAFGRPSRLFYAPLWALRLAGALTGRGAAVQRICGNFVVDTAPFRRDAQWQAPYKMSQGLDAVADAWRRTNRAGPV